MRISNVFSVILLLCAMVQSVSAERWSEAKANDWYANVPWLVGANFTPSTAINPIEMWQSDTFDPTTIDRELGWASSIGMNTMRVFLHNIPFEQDPRGFYNRVDHFLEIADRHEIKIMFVLFDGVWDPLPKAGLQPEPIPGLHNSGWVQCPGKEYLGDLDRLDELKPYVQEMVSRYSNDPRVLIWDLFNEPDNMILDSYGVKGSNIELPEKDKHHAVQVLLAKSFDWAREMNPTQPLTAGIWGRFDLHNLKPIEALSINESDVISFHCYEDPQTAKEQIAGLKKLNRPLFCTEYMARGNNNKFEDILPLYYKAEIAAYNWGLVDGKTQTIYAWDSWLKPYDKEPKLWFHDIFRNDGSVYDEAEVKLIKRLSAR